MADVTYNTTMFPALLRTLDALLSIPRHRRPPPSPTPDPQPADSTPGSEPLIVLAYKERDEGERSLFELALSKYRIKFELVDTVPGAGGNAVEIYVGIRRT